MTAHLPFDFLGLLNQCPAELDCIPAQRRMSIDFRKIECLNDSSACISAQQQQNMLMRQSVQHPPGIEYFRRIPALPRHCAMQHMPLHARPFHTTPAPTQLPPREQCMGRESFSMFSPNTTPGQQQAKQHTSVPPAQQAHKPVLHAIWKILPQVRRVTAPRPKHRDHPGRHAELELCGASLSQLAFTFQKWPG